jgi:quercetin dioxygenase-like cupin family protein
MTASHEPYIVRAGDGEALLNGVVVKLSPESGTQRSILVEQTFPSGGKTTVHLHEQGDELFYVISGSGTARPGQVENTKRHRLILADPRKNNIRILGLIQFR